MKRCSTVIIISIFLTGNLFASAEGRITSGTYRADMLEGVKTVMGREEQSSRWKDYEFSELQSLFTNQTLADILLSGQPVVPREELTLGVREVPIVERVGIPDAQLLAEVAQSVRPSGSVSKGQRRILMFGDVFIFPGDLLWVTHHGKEYALEVSEISENSYILRYNQSTLERTFERFDYDLETPDENS